MVKQLDDQREVDNLGRGQPATVVTTHHAVENGMEDLIMMLRGGIPG